MKRRDFFKSFSSIALLGALPSIAKAKKIKPEYNWKMVTTWPSNFPIFQEGAERFADEVRVMSNGRLNINVYAGGELVPALQVKVNWKQKKDLEFSHLWPFLFWIFSF